MLKPGTRQGEPGPIPELLFPIDRFEMVVCLLLNRQVVFTAYILYKIPTVNFSPAGIVHKAGFNPRPGLDTATSSNFQITIPDLIRQIFNPAP